MDKNSIGIKLGDGSFYPVLEEGFKGKKRFVLSTVRDGQESMQIDFYKGINGSIESSEYIGSLVIDNIKAAKKGVPEIEVVVGLDRENKLQAVAKNLASSEQQILSVSLETGSFEPAYTLGDFEIESRIEPEDLFKEDEELADTVEKRKDHPSKEVRKKPETGGKKPNPVFAALFVLGGLAVVAGLTILVWWLIAAFFPGKTVTVIDKSGKQTTVTSQNNQKTKTTKGNGSKTTGAKDTSKTGDKTTKSNSADKQKKDTSSKDKTAKPGVKYRVRKGDTLWDLSATYYRDAFQWYRIYRHKPNKIKNPDLIFVNQEIFIPEK